VADTILLIEDNADDEELTLRSLRKHKIDNRVTVTRDGAAALDYLFARGAHATRDPADLPKLVLLDLNLPKLDGLEVLRAIRGDPRTRVLIVVVLTSSKEDRDLVDAYSIGVNSYVVKPVEFAAFAKAIGEVANYWLVTNQAPST
jgi:two-component system response regulator